MPGQADRTLSTLIRVFVAPASNLKVAILLYAAIGVFLLLVLVVGVMFIMSSTDEEEADAAIDESPDGTSKPPRTTISTRPASPRRRVLLGAGAVLLLACVWVVAGYSTSDPGQCMDCHWSTSQHAKADKAADPHASVSCVECHESGGILGRYVTGVPLRALHEGLSWTGAAGESGYGRVTVRACSACHAESLAGTLTNEKRGLRVSHSQPLEASARCVDCHERRNGVVSVHNTGMKPCLRCHDGDKVSTACDTCHEGATGAATRARTASFRAEQIQDVTCDGCHNLPRDCDPCHGSRLPHTSDFKNGLHARTAVADLWFNGGKKCGRCHTASRRPCTRCHTPLLGKAHGTSMATVHKTADVSRCNTCHLEFARVTTRDFCKDLCHSKAAKAASPW